MSRRQTRQQREPVNTARLCNCFAVIGEHPVDASRLSLTVMTGRRHRRASRHDGRQSSAARACRLDDALACCGRNLVARACRAGDEQTCLVQQACSDGASSPSSHVTPPVLWRFVVASSPRVASIYCFWAARRVVGSVLRPRGVSRLATALYSSSRCCHRT